MPVFLGGLECINPQDLWESQRVPDNALPTETWFPLPNSFECPLGIQPGRGYALVAGQELNSLVIESGMTFHFKTTNIDDNGRTQAGPETLLKNLIFVRADSVNPGVDAQSLSIEFAEQDPYLVELSDRRILYNSMPIDMAYNTRLNAGPMGDVATYSPDSINLSTGYPWLWGEMVADLWARIPQLGPYNPTGAGQPFIPNGWPESFFFRPPLTAMQALGFTLNRLGCSLRLNPITDVFSTVRLGWPQDNALVGDTADHLRIWDARIAQAARVFVPEKVTVVFRQWPPPRSYWSPYYYTTLADPVNGVNPSSEANSRAVIFDDEFALMSDPVTATNNPQLLARAIERATDYYRIVYNCKLKNKVFHGTWSNPKFLPDTQCMATRWEELGVGYKTEMLNVAENFLPAFGSAFGGGGGFSRNSSVGTSHIIYTPVYANPTTTGPLAVLTDVFCYGGQIVKDYATIVF